MSRLNVLKPNPVAILNDADLQNAIALSEKMFVIIDIHQAWCGPATTIMPFFNQVWLDVDEANSRIYIGTLNVNNLELKKRILTAISTMNEIDIESQGCRPLFLIFRNSHVVAFVDGINPPMVDFYLKLFLPPLITPEKEANIKE